MKISIITPTFNYGHFLTKCLHSVWEQQEKKKSSDFQIEHIVIDGASPDGTPTILEKWAQTHKNSETYVFRWVSEPDKGQTDAINKGLRMASGEIVCWLNADEYYLPEKLSRVAQVFSNDPSIDFLYGEPLFVNADGIPIRIKYDHWFSKFVLLYHDCHISSCCSFWRRSIVDEDELLDDSYKVAMDYEYWCRLAHKGKKFQFLPETIGAFTWHDLNISTVFDSKRREEVLRVKKQYIPHGQELPQWVLTTLSFFAHQWRRCLVVARLLVLPKSHQSEEDSFHHTHK